MSEDNEQTNEHEGTFEPEPTTASRWAGWRERTFGMRGAVAVGLAGLVIGASGGFGLAAATHHDHDGGGPGELGRQWGGQQPSDQQGQPGPPMGGFPGGGAPPTTPPDTDGYSGGSKS